MPDLIKKIRTSSGDSQIDYTALANKPSIPSKVSDLTNDSGFLTDAPSDSKQYARKNGAWAEVQASGGTSDFDSLTNRPKYNGSNMSHETNIPEVKTATWDAKADASDIPTTLAELTGDATHRVVTDTEKATWNAKSDFSGSYNDLTNKPSIPTATLYQGLVYKIDGVSILAEEAQKASKDSEGNVISETYLTEHQSLSAYRTASAQDTIDDAMEADIDAIEGKIPAQATASNQLADKDFVNSSIGTNTANYISNEGNPFTSLAQLQAYTGTVTNNDYAFVTGTDEHGNSYFDRYKATVSGSSVTWSKEYRLNNSSFTAAQWSAISSGITASLVASYNSHIADTGVHVTSAEKTTWNDKVNSSNITHETWTFTLEDSTTVTKEVVLWQ